MIWLLLALVSLVAGGRYSDDALPAKRYERPYVWKSAQRQHPILKSDFCFGKPDGNYPIKRCQQKFLSCVGGVAALQYCPEKLVFDPILNRCEVADQSPHCTGGRVKPTPMTSPVPTQSPRKKPYFSCRHKKDGLYVDRRHPCRPFYFSCSNGEATVMHCPDGLFFDPELQICERYSSIPVCSGRPRPVTKKPVAHKKPLRVEPVDFDCRGKPSGNYANPHAKKPYCSMIYYTCSNGVATKRRCPHPLFYDPKRDVCDRFYNVFTCSGKRYAPTRPPKTTPQPTLPPVPFDCTQMKDGYYVNPRSRCSATYYACSGGVARKMKCQYGLAFDPMTKTCQPPSLLPICGGRPLPKTQPTRPPYRPITRPPPIDCSRRRDGLYPDPMHQCSRLFYSCSNGLAVRMECPPAMAFDYRTKSCQLASEMYICTGRHTTPMRATRPPVTRAPVPFDCSRRADGLYPNPRHLCSPFYYTCSNGYADRIDCPPGLFYDPHSRVCDVYSEIYVCTGRRKQKTPAPSYQGRVRPSNEFDCRGLMAGLYPSPGKRCSNQFFQCSNDVAYKLQCGHGLFFDPEHKRCDRYQNIYACTGRRQPMYRPKPTAKPYRQPEYEKIPIDCVQLGDGDHPEPGVLYGRTFYTCFNGRGVRRQCPKGTFFHVVLRRCESSESLKARYITTVKPKFYAKPVRYDVCYGMPNGRYPSNRCSSDFITCSGGVGIKQRCSPGLYFDADRMACDYKENIPLCGGRRPVYKPHSAERMMSAKKPSVNYDCSTRANGNYALAPCSSKYVSCTGGQAQWETCPGKLVFSDLVNRCDYTHETPSCTRRYSKPWK